MVFEHRAISLQESIAEIDGQRYTGHRIITFCYHRSCLRPLSTSSQQRQDLLLRLLITFPNPLHPSPLTRMITATMEQAARRA